MQKEHLENARKKVDESVAPENRTHLCILLRRIKGAKFGPIRPYMSISEVALDSDTLSLHALVNHPGARFKTISIVERVVKMRIGSPVFVQECARQPDGTLNPTNIVIGQATRKFDKVVNKLKPEKIDLIQGPDLRTTLSYFRLGEGQVTLAKDHLTGGPHFKIIYDKEAAEIGHHGPYPITLEGYSEAFLDMQPSRVILAAYVLNEIDRQLAYIGNSK